ncbi:hypothetical protein K504DRAFT_522217 [Pleomassaria siparia CBS 279.74]|uniref:Uncharacterized protein n=1 Tax=Pleomassaria siparia CBS 279.74 TaxID=1314801 RepID=A0A6G1KJH2_9PLEO|nr:hypothetical protein K504DRAFT_522217 [Pleomassaria siparia CBS 279.74]
MDPSTGSMGPWSLLRLSHHAFRANYYPIHIPGMEQGWRAFQNSISQEIIFVNEGNGIWQSKFPHIPVPPFTPTQGPPPLYHNQPDLDMKIPRAIPCPLQAPGHVPYYHGEVANSQSIPQEHKKCPLGYVPLAASGRCESAFTYGDTEPCVTCKNVRPQVLLERAKQTLLIEAVDQVTHWLHNPRRGLHNRHGIDGIRCEFSTNNFAGINITDPEDPWECGPVQGQTGTCARCKLWVAN